MSAGFNVVLGDLASMAKTFKQEAVTYAGLHASVAPPIADGGDAGLNDAIAAVTHAISGLHLAMGDRIKSHGDKLQYAHDSYQRHDVDVHGVFEDLMGD